MTVSTTTSRADYTGNGTTTAFAVPFYFLEDSHLTVIRTQISTNVSTTLALTTDYTVTGAGVPAGGTVTCVVAPTSAQKLTILRNVPLTQLNTYVPNDPFPAASHEQALDKLTMLGQKINEAQSRSLTLNPLYSGISTTLPAPSANALIGWNASANALQSIDPSAVLTVAASSSFNYQTFSGNGVQTSFTLSGNPGILANLEVYISGVRQTPVTVYNFNDTTLTFTQAPPSGTNNILVRWGQTFGIGTVGDGLITPAKLSTGGPYWDTSGNVGVGNTLPGSKLDVSGGLRLRGSTSGYVGISPAAAAGSTTYTLPSADGSNGQTLTTNGAGTLSWSSSGVTASIVRNTQTGTSYTVLTGDRGKWVTFNNAASVGVTLPQANGSTFGGGWYFYAENIGSGVVTITPTTSTINTAATLVLTKGQWALIESDDTNYRAVLGGAPGRQTIWVPASAMTARTDTSGGGPTLATFTATTNKTTLPGLAFDPATVEYAQFSVRMPKGWDEGTVSYAVAWSHASTTTNFGVAWSLQAVAISDLDALDVAMGTAQQVNDTGGTTDTLYVTAEPGTAVTIAGTPQPQDLVVFQISRVATDATNDTMAIDARLHGVTIYYTTDVADDR